MHVTTQTAIGVLSAAALAGSAVGGVSAFGKHGNHGRHNGATVFRSSVAPSLPGPPAIHGVNAGGLPWVLRSGEIRLRRGGRFQVRVRGLVIPNPQGDNTPGPVTTVSAALYCGADTDMTAAATTTQVPLSRKGQRPHRPARHAAVDMRGADRARAPERERRDLHRVERLAPLARPTRRAL